MNKKWIGVIVLAVVGVILAFVAIEWLSEPIWKVPQYLGGKPALVHGHHVRGHYRRRGEALAVLAVIAFAGAAYLAWTIKRAPAAVAGDGPAEPATVAAPAAPEPAPEAATSADLLSGASAGAESSASAPEPPDQA